ncbi:MAG: malonyl-CoA-[acyl-carrier-protein] transacylase, partial [Pseudomonadota bacterium]
MKFAFFFPGQGSQSVGMMQGLADISIVRETFTEASDILGQDFWSMVTEPNEALNQTANTQPLMLTAGVATWRAWQQASDLNPCLMAGHSLGEYTALVAAGTLSFKDALPLVRYRAEVMQGAVAEGVGAMAAILGLDDDTVRQVCAQAAQGEVVEAVNLNSPGQVVIAGNKAAVERGMELAKEKGAKRALPLPVSVPSHCALMKPAAAQLAQYLESVTITSGQVPVIHNADVAAYDDAAKIKDALVRQLYNPVRWVETVQHVHQQGILATAECGPGKVLAGLT